MVRFGWKLKWSSIYKFHYDLKEWSFALGSKVSKIWVTSNTLKFTIVHKDIKQEVMHAMAVASLLGTVLVENYDNSMG